MATDEWTEAATMLLNAVKRWHREHKEELGAKGLGMTDQLDLFSPRPGIVGHNHPETSHAAALAVMPRTGSQRRAVLDFVAKCGDLGATDLELQTALGLSGNSERPRRIELVQAGWIEDSGKRREGHIVWRKARD